MFLPFSLLHLAELVLPLSLCVGAALAQNSAFTIKAHGTGYKTATSSGALTQKNVGVTTSDDLQYTVDITLGGQNFTVLLDTGSTDLWVNTKGHIVHLTNTTSLETGITYGKGEVEGNIDFAEVRIGDFVIDSQAFINPTRIVDFPLSGLDGIMGMAFDVGNIYSTIKQAWGTDAADKLGRAPITSLFAQDPDLPNNFDVQLARTSELEDIADGVFLISGHASGFEAVAQEPKLPRINSAHWSIVMDAMAINGKQFAFNKSRIASAPAGKVVAALDTGFSFPPLPPAAVDAIYGGIPGAAFDPVGDIWVVPCNASVNLTFTFGGKEFPVHPLDLTFPFVAQILVDGKPKNITACFNTYQYLTLDPSSFVGFDLIMGDAFLRSVYASFDYGDYYPARQSLGLPFVQMLSTTDNSKMWAEFYEERAAALADLPAEIDPSLVVKYDKEQAAHASDPNSNSNCTNLSVSGAASGDGVAVESADSWGKKYGMVALGLLAANLLVGIVLLAVTLTMCLRGGIKGRSSARYAPVRFKDGDEQERGSLKYSD